MSNSGSSLPLVGVQYVAQGSEQYTRSVMQATEATSALVKKMLEEGNSVTKVIEALQALGFTEKEVEKELKTLTNTTLQSTIAQAKAAQAFKDTTAAEGAASIGAQQYAKAMQETAVSQGSVANQKLGEHFTSASSAIGASRVGVGLFTRELVQMVGGSNVATQALDSFVYATGSLGIALGVASAGLVLLREGTKQASEEFEKHQQIVANTTKSYRDFELQRFRALQGSAQGLATGIPASNAAFTGAFTEVAGRLLGDTWGKGFLLGVQGQLTPSAFLQIFQHGVQGALSAPSDFLNKAVQNYTASQQEVATQQFVAGAGSRAASLALQDEIANLKLEGASYDELIPKVYDYLKAKQAAGQFTGSGANGTITGKDTVDAIGSFDTSGALAKRASDFANKLRDVYAQGAKEIEGIDRDHVARMQEISDSGHAQELRIEREFQQRRKQIQDQYDQDTRDAFTDYRSRIADAEADAQDKRNKIVQDFSDKRVEIEQNYQDRIAQIQSEYALSLVDIDARRDGLALLRARASRDKALADAAKSRDKDNQSAQKQREKQEKDISDSLEKQKREAQQEYDRHLRDLKQNLDKQNEQNKQGRQDQLTDLNASLRAQEKAENDSYGKRRQAAIDQIEERRKALVAALIQDQKLTVEYAKAIIDSLSSVLDPDRITKLVQDLQEALDTTISIKITPKGGEGGGNKQPAAPSLGNQSGYGTPGSFQKTSGVVTEPSRTSLAMGTRVSTSNSGGKVYIYVDNAVNSAMLDSQIRTTSLGVTTEVIRRGKGY